MDSESGESQAAVAPASFGEVAPYYDALMAVVPYRMWVGYYLLLLSQHDAHPKRLLDVGCGTGTMCEMLTGDGFKMEGLDLSAGMIERARAKAEAKHLPIQYHVGDAAGFSLGKTFEGALSFFDSLNNIIEPHRFREALKSVAGHLEPGGTFIFDLNTAYAFEQRMFDQTHMKPGAPLRYRWRGEWDEVKRLITVRMQFWTASGEFEEIHVQRAYEESTVREWLLDAGFSEVFTYHSYTLERPRRTTDRIHYVAVMP